jgi:hypothetical protein
MKCSLFVNAQTRISILIAVDGQIESITMDDDDHQGLPPPAEILGDNEARWNPPGFFVPPPLQPAAHQLHHPENDVESHGSPRSSGWSEVETVGGVAPSARSLHSAALLNVSH